MMGMLETKQVGSDQKENNFILVLGIAGVQKRVESSGPRRNLARKCENGKTCADYCRDSDDEAFKEQAEVLFGHIGTEVVDEGVDLAKPKDSKGQHVLAGLHRLEPNKADLHGQQSAKSVHGAVGDVDAVAEAASNHQDQHVERYHVDEEHIASPGAHHVEVGNAAKGSPVDFASLHAFDPQVVGEQHAKYRNGLVVIAASHTSGNISRHDCDHACGTEASASGVQLGGEEVGDDCREGRERWRQEDAHLSHVDGHVDHVEDVVEEASSDHETGIDCSSNNPTKWIPGSVVKPVVKVVETLIREVLGCSVVEVRIELMDDRLKAKDREEPDGEGQDGGDGEDGQLEKRFLLLLAEPPKDPSVGSHATHPAALSLPLEI